MAKSKLKAGKPFRFIIKNYCRAKANALNPKTINVILAVTVVALLIAGGAFFAIDYYLNARSGGCGYDPHLEAFEKIAGATDNWALDEGKKTGDMPTYTDLIGYNKYLKETPVCPYTGYPIPLVPVGVEIETCACGYVSPFYTPSSPTLATSHTLTTATSSIETTITTPTK